MGYMAYGMEHWPPLCSMPFAYNQKFLVLQKNLWVVKVKWKFGYNQKFLEVQKPFYKKVFGRRRSPGRGDL